MDVCVCVCVSLRVCVRSVPHITGSDLKKAPRCVCVCVCVFIYADIPYSCAGHPW